MTKNNAKKEAEFSQMKFKQLLNSEGSNIVFKSDALQENKNPDEIEKEFIKFIAKMTVARLKNEK